MKIHLKIKFSFFVTSVSKFGWLWVHHVDMTFCFALILTCNWIWCIDTTKTSWNKYLDLICRMTYKIKFYKIVALFTIGYAKVMLSWLFFTCKHGSHRFLLHLWATWPPKGLGLKLSLNFPHTDSSELWLLWYSDASVHSCFSVLLSSSVSRTQPSPLILFPSHVVVTKQLCQRVG